MMRIVLGKGEHSTVFVDTDEPNIVIKESKHSGENQSYIRRQRTGYDIIDKIKAYNHDTGVILPELIDITGDVSNQVIREKLIPGNFFDYKTYFSLTEQERDNVAKQMALFLNTMHSCATCEPAHESIKNMFNGRINNADDIIAKFDGKLPKNIATKLKQAEEYVLSSDMSDEFIVMTHKDLRIHNIMYDRKTKKIAVIDFELAGMDNVYHDFVAKAPTSSMPWDFTKRVIKYYNKIPNKKYPITIDQRKVQSMLLYGAMHEFARCIKPGDNDNKTEKDFAPICMDLEIVTGINFDTKSVLEKGTRMVQNKLPKIQPDITHHM